MTENRRYSITFFVHEIPPVLCLCYEIEKDIFPLYPLVRAIATRMFWNSQRKCHKIVTVFFTSFQNMFIEPLDIFSTLTSLQIIFAVRSVKSIETS